MQLEAKVQQVPLVIKELSVNKVLLENKELQEAKVQLVQ